MEAQTNVTEANDVKKPETESAPRSSHCYAAETLSDHEWNMLDDLCMELGVGAGDPPGGWFNITPDHIRALESLIDRLGCEDDRNDRITRLQDVVNRMERALLQIVMGRNEFQGSSLDYMQGYRDGQEHQARIARKALGHGG